MFRNSLTSRSLMTAAAMASLWLLAQSAAAQSAAAREYMEASSPLKKGGVVVTRTAPGRQVETVLYRETPGLTRTSTVVERPSDAERPVETQANVQPSTTPAMMPTNPSPPAADVYPYPQAPASVAPGFYPGVVQVPNLGYYGRTTQRPSWFGQPTQPPRLFSGGTPNPGFSPPMTAPIVTSPPAASPQIQMPQVIPPGQSVTTGYTPWTQPFATQPPGPQPVIRFQNMPPGAYMGQGIVGQPKAYVDGQPIRNFLRFLAPF